MSAGPEVQAYRDLRGRLAVFDPVDVGLPIEIDYDGTPFAFTHVIRNADSRSVLDIHQEIRAVQADPAISPSVQKVMAARAYLLVPGFVRTWLLGSLHRMPARQRALAGTIGVTAVGMFAGGGGWGIAFQVHTLNVVIGGIAKRPVVSATGLQEHDWLQLTVSVDHDVVDGAPAARFVALLRRLLTSADLLAALNGPAAPDRQGLADVQLKSS